MKMTSAEANKMIRQLKAEYAQLLNKDRKSSTFLAVLGEDPDTVRPVYDYDQMQADLSAIEQKIRVLKHAIFRFNLTTVIDELGMTIDECLILIPQLSSRSSRLLEMAGRLPKEREKTSMYGQSTNIVDYRYTNYDVEQVEADYLQTCEELAAAQTALDKVNTTVQFDVDL